MQKYLLHSVILWRHVQITESPTGCARGFSTVTPTMQLWEFCSLPQVSIYLGLTIFCRGAYIKIIKYFIAYRRKSLRKTLQLLDCRSVFSKGKVWFLANVSGKEHLTLPAPSIISEGFQHFLSSWFGMLQTDPTGKKLHQLLERK